MIDANILAEKLKQLAERKPGDPLDRRREDRGGVFSMAEQPFPPSGSGLPTVRNPWRIVRNPLPAIGYNLPTIG
ncbi:MAG TPA: hypothetical protein VH394_23525 [Thermoanaerobaculia bacterium]|nr:hypothetical protein [Thermoanaerobaculia bacterium]